MPTRSLRALAACAALVVALASCSDSVKDDGPATGGDDGGGPEQRTTRGVTDDAIRVGGVVYDLYFGDARVGVEARLKEVNDAGGVHGRQIEVVAIENDDNDANTGREITQRLVEQEEVFALLPVMSGLFGGGDYIVDNGIPTFGWGVNPAFCENEVAFGITGCVTNPSLEIGSNALGTVLEAHFGDTDRTVAFIGEDNDSGRGGLTLLSASVEDKGFEVVTADASLPAPPDPLGDPSPFVSQLLSSADGEAPDVIYLQATLSGTTIAAALQASGYEGMIITPSYSPLLLGQPGYDGVYVNTQIDMDPTVPANAAMLEAVAAVNPDQALNLAVAAGYWATDMFVKALEETGEDLTVESFLATLNGGDFTYGVEGVVGDSSWPDNRDRSVPCAALYRVDGDEFVTEINLVCGENIEVG
ncbi:MAG: ABC transporter substrate-binding protein [Acidimicrobiales bacterium]|nr:ABC transporter substrate-binding protein [Acidimicrobiales bacterium]